MKLSDALGPRLKDDLKAGLEALKRDDRRKVKLADGEAISGSLDLDLSLRKDYPSDHRWDYVVGRAVNRQDDELYYLEIHPARNDEVAVVRRKRQWLENWIHSGQTSLSRLRERSKFYWIASGRIMIQKNSRQDRLIRKLKLYPVKELTIG